MLYGFLSSLYIFFTVFTVLLILIQKGKSSMGLGSMGGGQQALFGGSGGTDFFQKLTWVLGFTLIFGSLGLSILKQHNVHVGATGARAHTEQPAPQQA